MSIRNRQVIGTVLRAECPQIVSKEYGSVVLTQHQDILYLSMTDGKYCRVANLPEGLVMLVKAFYAFDIQYPSKLFHLLDVMCGGDAKLSNPQQLMLK